MMITDEGAIALMEAFARMVGHDYIRAMRTSARLGKGERSGHPSEYDLKHMTDYIDHGNFSSLTGIDGPMFREKIHAAVKARGWAAINRKETADERRARLVC